jgi:hypothetical protein
MKDLVKKPKPVKGAVVLGRKNIRHSSNVEEESQGVECLSKEAQNLKKLESGVRHKSVSKV